MSDPVDRFDRSQSTHPPNSRIQEEQEARERQAAKEEARKRREAEEAERQRKAAASARLIREAEEIEAQGAAAAAACAGSTEVEQKELELAQKALDNVAVKPDPETLGDVLDVRQLTQSGWGRASTCVCVSGKTTAGPENDWTMDWSTH